MVRPKTTYSREDLRAAFQIVQGRRSAHGVSDVDKLSRALRCAAGGMDADQASDILSILGDGQIGGYIDYEDIIDLMMGADPSRNKDKEVPDPKKKRSHRWTEFPGLV